MQYTLDDNLYENLNKSDLKFIFDTLTRLLPINDIESYKKSLLEFSEAIEFEYTFFGYVTNTKDADMGGVQIFNINNAEAWLNEYMENKYFLNDPLAGYVVSRDERAVCVSWADFEDQALLNPESLRIRNIRDSFGLHYGFTSFDNLLDASNAFSYTVASSTNQGDPRIINTLKIMTPHFLNRMCIIDGIIPVADYDITNKELEVLNWIKEGKTNWEIGTIMNISEQTVKFHVKNILTKLNASNRQQAVAVAMSSNLISYE